MKLNLNEVFKKFERDNNTEGLSHNERLIQRYSLKVKDSKGVEFDAIPVLLIDSFVKQYRQN